MFCPRCSAHNETEQKYCRQCGLPLVSVRLCIEGSMNEALIKYKKGGDLLSSGIITLLVFVLIALFNFFMSSEARNYGMAINLVLGLLITLPMIITGLVRVSRAQRLLNQKDNSQIALNENSRQPEILSAAHTTNSLLTSLPAPGSVTEQATLKLKQPEQRR